MKVRDRYNSWLARALGVAAITLYPWIFFRDSYNQVPYVLELHEEVHVEQVRQEGYFMYVKYLGYFVQGLWRNRRYISKPKILWRRSYLQIPYEREARRIAAKRPVPMISDLKNMVGKHR